MNPLFDLNGDGNTDLIELLIAAGALDPDNESGEYDFENNDEEGETEWE